MTDNEVGEVWALLKNRTPAHKGCARMIENMIRKLVVVRGEYHDETWAGTFEFARRKACEEYGIPYDEFNND